MSDDPVRLIRDAPSWDRDRKIREVVAAAREEGRRAGLVEGTQRTHFACVDCGHHVAVDEDGCCAQCGQDCSEELCGCPSATPPLLSGAR